MADDRVMNTLSPVRWKRTSWAAHRVTDLDGVAEAYAAMDERRAIKSLLRLGTV